ncbi:MAG: acyl-CoA thioesterase [Myxococcota bacterium]
MSSPTDLILPPPAFQDPVIRTTLLPRDTNAHGTIFGGIILSHIDIAGAVGAHRLGIPRVVTVAMKEVTFHEPVFVGDLLSLYVWPTRMGRTSVTVHVLVHAERAGRIEPDGLLNAVRVTEADVTYVAVDEHRKPVSIVQLKPRVEALIAAAAARVSSAE